MIENTTYFKCRPSQLMNLQTFLLTILAIPILVLLTIMLEEQQVSSILPEKMAVHIDRLPIYLSVYVLINLFWQILKVWCICYEIDPEKLKYSSGIILRKHEFVENYRIKDFLIEKPLIYRIFDLGNLTIYTSDKTTPILHLYAIRKPKEKYQILRGLVELSRKEKHVYEID
ncbi:MAG: PH domain-containing protein [Prolixibacteraceae bacterium]|jgi:uncharacterized membrane protein YdbT with pleckstrin-like domain|nr:PH domain-containing protein [Prolixibacteraceae bacterium]